MAYIFNNCEPDADRGKNLAESMQAEYAKAVSTDATENLTGVAARPACAVIELEPTDAKLIAACAQSIKQTEIIGYDCDDARLGVANHY